MDNENQSVDPSYIPTASELLAKRVSCAVLTGPAPEGDVLDRIQSAALRAPDHMCLRPWRFIRFSGEARKSLGAILASAAAAENPDLNDEELDKIADKTLRAPLIIAGIVRYHEHPRVPPEEQLLSAGAAMSFMLAAAQAEDFGAIWRTGPLSYHPLVAKRLMLQNNEALIGFLYMGTPGARIKSVPSLERAEFFSEWPKPPEKN